MYENLTNAEYPSEISDLLAKLKTQSPPKITAGNFFGNKVNEFNARYKEEVIWGTSKKDIDGIANDEGAYTIEQYLEKFPDPYKTLGYEISDFDVINAYQFKINTPAVIDYLANSCKKGARIIINYDEVHRLDAEFAKYHNIKVIKTFANHCAVLEII